MIKVKFKRRKTKLQYDPNHIFAVLVTPFSRDPFCINEMNEFFKNAFSNLQIIEGMYFKSWSLIT